MGTLNLDMVHQTTLEASQTAQQDDMQGAFIIDSDYESS